MNGRQPVSEADLVRAALAEVTRERELLRRRMSQAIPLVTGFREIVAMLAKDFADEFPKDCAVMTMVGEIFTSYRRLKAAQFRWIFGREEACMTVYGLSLAQVRALRYRDDLVRRAIQALRQARRDGPFDSPAMWEAVERVCRSIPDNQEGDDARDPGQATVPAGPGGGLAGNGSQDAL